MKAVPSATVYLSGVLKLLQWVDQEFITFMIGMFISFIYKGMLGPFE